MILFKSHLSGDHCGANGHSKKERDGQSQREITVALQALSYLQFLFEGLFYAFETGCGWTGDFHILQIVGWWKCEPGKVVQPRGDFEEEYSVAQITCGDTSDTYDEKG